MTEENEQAAEQAVEHEEIVKAEESKQQEQAQSDKDYNFAQVRKQLKEKDEYIRAIQQEVESLKKGFAAKSQPEEPELEEDDYVTKKYLVRDAQKIAKQEIEQALKSYEQQNYHIRAKNTYADYDSVVTPDNIAKLEEEMPDIAQLIAQSDDRYKMACSTYKAIKALNRSNSQSKEIEKNMEAMKKNQKEPMAAASIDKRPIAKAARLTDKDYRELWEETQYYASKA